MAGKCICIVLVVSLLVGCGSWRNSGVTTRNIDEHMLEHIAVDSGVRDYHILISRQYLPQETLSLLQTETIFIKGRDIISTMELTKERVVRDTIYIEQSSGGVVNAEPARSSDVNRWGWLAVSVVAIVALVYVLFWRWARKCFK